MVLSVHALIFISRSLLSLRLLCPAPRKRRAVQPSPLGSWLTGVVVLSGEPSVPQGKGCVAPEFRGSSEISFPRAASFASILQSRVALKGVSEKSLNVECDANAGDRRSSVMALPKGLVGWSLLLRVGPCPAPPETLSAMQTLYLDCNSPYVLQRRAEHL